MGNELGCSQHGYRHPTKCCAQGAPMPGRGISCSAMFTMVVEIEAFSHVFAPGFVESRTAMGDS
jgi:hypothetical protein